MLVSPIAWVTKDMDWALEEARKSAEVTHNHPEEGINTKLQGRSPEAVAVAVFLARTGGESQQGGDS
jgi:ADP-ribosyl-[dinitrogen reductase] hydrolase